MLELGNVMNRYHWVTASHGSRKALSSWGLLAVLTGLLPGCKKAEPREVPTVPVTVATVERRAAPEIVAADGVVEPLQTVSVEAQVSGIISRVDFVEGQDVVVGQPLFLIDPRPYQAALQQAEANLARDQVQAASSERDAVRYKTLAAQDYVTQAQADQMEATAASQRAAAKADSAAVESARLNLSYTLVRAPIAGRTGGLLVHLGNLVKTTGGPLVVINQIRPILVRFSVPQSLLPEIQRYRAKGPLSVSVRPSEGNGDEAEGTLSFIDNQVDDQTGTVMLKARFANEEGHLWPGQYVRARLQLYVEANALVVPSAAVMTGQDGSYVFVVDSQNRAQKRDVVVGRSLDDVSTITNGVAAGDRVVTDGQLRLATGTPVTIRTETAAAVKDGTS
jgi:membrane fusion protein, multidrug efflux system